MKIHTQNCKNNLKDLGRQLDSIITYTNEQQEEIILHDELYSVDLNTNANILKSVMKELDLETTVDIPLGTVLHYELGIKSESEQDFEYLNYGNYVVYKSEKQEDTNTYLLTCYDKMLYSMRNYEDLGITYPISIKNYLYTIGVKLGITVQASNFQNQNMMIPAELYLDSQGNDLGYTFRDVLDEIAQATGSIICINENDMLEVRYPTVTNDTIDESFLKDVNVNFSEKYRSYQFNSSK